jgi:tRNA (mo5U34)-methyltransferase
MAVAAAAADLATQAKAFYWYHCIDLGGGVVTDGDYAMSAYLQHYGLPGSMAGMRVLDVGRASGFFSFEFERRGADVTATDIASFFEWDFVGGDLRKEEVRRHAGDERAFTTYNITGAFDFAHRVKRSRVKSKLINVYDLQPEAFGGDRFDLVFAGSITSHLRDPIGALERLHRVTRGTCVIAAPTITLPKHKDLPLMSLVGLLDSDQRSWWVMNLKCLVEMMRCANFKDVKVVAEFNLVHRRQKDLVVPHAVLHGRA